MGKTQTAKTSFGDFDISDLGDDFGLILGKKESENHEEIPGKEDKKPEKTGNSAIPGFIDMTNKIQIPETKEEFENMEAALKKELSGDDDDTNPAKETTSTKEKKGKTEEIIEQEGDAIITEDSPLYIHAATLLETGILPTLNLDELKGKTFDEAIKLYTEASRKYIDDGRKEYENSLSERQKEFLELIENGIPPETVESQFRVEDAYSRITDEMIEEDENLAKQLITQSLKLKGLSEKKISVFLKSAEDDTRLSEEAKEAKDEINAYIAEQKQQMIENAKSEEKEREQKEKELKETIRRSVESTGEILPGIKVSADEKTRLLELMTKPVEIKTINGQKVPINLINKTRNDDRINFDLRLNYYIGLGLFDKSVDSSKLIKKLTSKVATSVTEKLKEDVGSPGGKGVQKSERRETKTPSNIIFPDLSNFK